MRVEGGGASLLTGTQGLAPQSRKGTTCSAITWLRLELFRLELAERGRRRDGLLPLSLLPTEALAVGLVVALADRPDAISGGSGAGGMASRGLPERDLASSSGRGVPLLR